MNLIKKHPCNTSSEISWETLSNDSYSALRTHVHALLDCRAKSERLDSLGISRGTLVFSSYTKTYKTKKEVADNNCDNTVSISDFTKSKRYTNVYIIHNHKKEYVHKKKTSLKTLLELHQLAIRTEISYFTKAHRKAANIACNLYNASRPCKAAEIDLDAMLESEYEAYKGTVQYAESISFVDNELSHASVNALMGRPEFKNEIFLTPVERYRSKNELIAACALNAAGIAYEVEPQYPGVSRCRADFGLTENGHKIYVEIAGMMNDEKYQHDLLEKRHLAKQNHLPFVIIDMTDYEDETGRNRTRLNFSMLKRIFINICLGKIKCAGEIIRPYVNAPPAAAQKGV